MSATSASSATPVFFDPLELGAVFVGDDGRPRHLEPFRDVPGLLRELSTRAVLGVLSLGRPGDLDGLRQALKSADLIGFFDPGRIVLATGRSQAFASLSALSDLPPRGVFVGRDAGLRDRAVEAGLATAPHRLLAPQVLDGETLHFLRLTRPRAERGVEVSLPTRPPILPLLRDDEPEPTLYAVTSRSGLEALRALDELEVEVLGSPEDVARGSLYRIQLSQAERAGEERLAGFLGELDARLSFVRETPAGFLASVPGSLDVESLHPPVSSHGHLLEMAPSAALPQPPAPPPPPAALMSSLASTSAPPPPPVFFSAAADVALYQSLLDPLRGQAPLTLPDGSQATLASRHVEHPDNEVATLGLKRSLETIPGVSNVHRVLTHHAGGSGRPIYLVYGDIAGDAPELVVVGAHLDSTAANSWLYPGNETTDVAPGADDDASGAAGVLFAAHRLATASQTARPPYTLRFVLFNAEEQGLYGSEWFAAALQNGQRQVAAMFQMDMIGHAAGVYPKGVFQVHGTTAQEFAKASAASASLAARVVQAAQAVSPDLVPQVFPLSGCPKDPATGRSDHSRFHARDWPAVLVCAELWEARCQAPAWTGNPEYHKREDTQVELAFATDVARAVAAAAWNAAHPGTWIPLPPAPPGAGPGDSTSPPSAPAPGGDPHSSTEPAPDASAATGGSPMPQKFLVEFLADWIRDEQFRCAVLYQEQTSLDAYGLTQEQKTALLSLDKKQILAQIHKELEQYLAIDLDKLRDEVGGPVPVPGPGGTPTLPDGTRMLASTAFALLSAINEAALYGQGRVHLRGAKPAGVAKDKKRLVVLRGQGFDVKPEVEFVKDSKIVQGEVQEITCDVDVYQRVLVKVKLDEEGEWKVRARNDSSEPWSTEDVPVLAL